jgi:tRNA 2-selenouridine synthase
MPREARPVPVAVATAELDRYTLIIDARSPGEFALDHLPGARNLPVLDDVQRARIGTQYKHAGVFEAKREGAALVARNIAAHLDGPLAALPRDARCLVYCWRGGNRSGALATVMARVGWEVDVLEGGYRAFRRQVVADLATWPAKFRFHVVAGPTGCGKSLLLARIADRGAQVLDLEALAAHRGSVLGQLPDRAQPSQKRFETAVWDALRRSDPAQPSFVESESRKVGQCQVPEALIAAIRASSRGSIVSASMSVRCALLLREYRHFIESPERLLARLAALVAHHGHGRVAQWSSLAQDRHWEQLVASLLEHHYDPAYAKSMQRNFMRLAEFASVTLDDASEAAIDALALRLLADASGS